MSGLKLVRWANDNFPPIDLNENVSHVKELVNEYKTAKAHVKLLRKSLEKADSILESNKYYMESLDRKQITEILNQTK